MEVKSEDSIKRFAEAISKDKKLFEEQLSKVEKEYPLVGLAFQVQRALIYELCMPRSLMDTEVGILQEGFDPVLGESIARSQIEQQQRLKDLWDCLILSHRPGPSSGEQYQAGLACFKNYLKRNYP